MATPFFPFFLLILLSLQTPPISTTSTPFYFSNPTFSIDYHKMLSTFKIFIYPNPNPNPNPNDPFNFTTPPLSLFYASLLRSPFLTHDPAQAHLFFLPFSPQSTRSLARVIQHVRTSYSFWDRSLGADHFFLSCHGVGPSSSRNVVELRKNAVQVSCFPTTRGAFVPHKDVTLPPPTPSRALVGSVSSTRHLGYWRFSFKEIDLISGLRDDPEFLIESEPSDERVYYDRVSRSKFCLVVYDEEEVVGLGVALAQGCVPVVITDRPIQDMPLMDVIRWSEIALFVGSRVGHEELKRVMKGTCESGSYERMRRLGAAAAQHFVWNESPQPLDAFNMVMYQLWVRRHAIRYARWDNVEVEVSSA